PLYPIRLASTAPARTRPPSTTAIADPLRVVRSKPLGSMAQSHGRAAANCTPARISPATNSIRSEVIQSNMKRNPQVCIAKRPNTHTPSVVVRFGPIVGWSAPAEFIAERLIIGAARNLHELKRDPGLADAHGFAAGQGSERPPVRRQRRPFRPTNANRIRFVGGIHQRPVGERVRANR